MFDLFLEDGDLLEAVEIMNLINESYIEESVKLDKNRLDDIDYIKDIINQIKNSKDKKKTTSNILMMFGALSMITIIGIPVGILIVLLSEQISKHAENVEIKDLENIIKTIKKAISDLNAQYESSSDKNAKKELKNTINKLEKANKEITISIDKIKNPSKYKKKNQDAVKSLDTCISKLKELLSKPKYSDLKNSITIDIKLTGNKLYNDFIYGDEDYLDIADYDVNKINKLIDSGKYDDWDDIFNLMDELMNDVNKNLNDKYKLDFGEDSGVDRGGFAIIRK